MAKNVYSDKDIKSMEGIAHMRHRPQMYGFSAFGKSGIYLMCKEIIDNAIDEAVVTPEKQHHIQITFIKKRNTFQMIVVDTGRGVPLNKVKPSFTKMNTSGKWGSSYDSSVGTNGVGAKGVVALSSAFVAISKRKEGLATLVTKTAKILSSGVLKKKSSDGFGTTIFFEPDTSIMKNAKTFFQPDGGYEDVYNLVEFASITLSNTKFTIRIDNQPLTTDSFSKTYPTELLETLQKERGEVVYETDDSISLVHYLLKKRSIEHQILWDSGLIVREGLKVPVTVQTGLLKKSFAALSFKLQFLLTLDSYGRGGTRNIGSVNMVRIDDKQSSHLNAPIQKIKEFIQPHVDPKYKDFFEDYYSLPLHMISLVSYQHAVYINQDKSKFVDGDFELGYASEISKIFSSVEPSYWVILHDKIADDIKLKWSRKHKRDLKLSSDGKNLAFSLHNPRCYYECKQTGPGTELLICEGVSSGDYVKQLRNPNTQAVFELKGKILNAFRKGGEDLTILQKNKVISDLLQVLGTSPEDDTLEHMRFERIGILSDADADGNHITSLVLSDLFHINRALFDGRIFVLNPPLYILNMKGSKCPIFLRDRSALNRFQSELYLYEFDVSMKIGKNIHKLEGEQFHAVCWVIRHLGGLIKDVGNKQHIDPSVLEMLVYCVDDLKNVNTKALAKKLELDSCRFDKKTQTLYLQLYGYETVVPMNGLIKEISSRLLPELKKYNMADIEFILSSKSGNYYNNTSVGLMTLLNAFSQLDSLYKMRRMKGIGEMDKKHLIATCLNPKTRSCTLIKSIGDIVKISELMGSDSEARKKLVMENVE